MEKRILVVAVALVLIASMASRAGAEERVERNVVFGMDSGLALLMDVYYPEAANANGHGIVFIAGTAWTRQLGMTGSGWTADLNLDAPPLNRSGQEELYAQPLVVAGYTVFAINHRTAPRFRHPGHLEDAQRAVRFVRHHAATYGIDADRIGAMGSCSGGHLAGLLGVLDGAGIADASPVDSESAKVQVVVAHGAPTDLTLSPPNAVHPLFGHRRSSRTDSIEYRRFLDASPVTHVTDDDATMLLIHGDADESVPFQHSVVMKRALEKAGVPVDLLRLYGAGHEPLLAPHYIDAMVAWFDRHLPARQ